LEGTGDVAIGQAVVVAIPHTGENAGQLARRKDRA